MQEGLILVPTGLLNFSDYLLYAGVFFFTLNTFKMKPQEENYPVVNMQTGNTEFTGTLAECNNFIMNYGLGNSFLYMPTFNPDNCAFIKLVNPQN